MSRRQLGGRPTCASLGLELERQDFHVFLGTELWDTRLHLTVDGQEIEVPADGLRGPRDDVTQALRFDSDGVLNDSARDPVVVEGPVVLVRSADELKALKRKRRARARSCSWTMRPSTARAGQHPAGGTGRLGAAGKRARGLVLVTTFSNEPGESHGAFVGDERPHLGGDEPRRRPSSTSAWRI